MQVLLHVRGYYGSEKTVFPDVLHGKTRYTLRLPLKWTLDSSKKLNYRACLKLFSKDEIGYIANVDRLSSVFGSPSLSFQQSQERQQRWRLDVKLEGLVKEQVATSPGGPFIQIDIDTDEDVVILFRPPDTVLLCQKREA